MKARDFDLKLPVSRSFSAYDLLTPQQKNVARNLALGIPIKEAAEMIGTSVKTVQYHWAQLRTRLGISTYADLVHWALACGLIENKFRRRCTTNTTT